VEWCVKPSRALAPHSHMHDVTPRVPHKHSRNSPSEEVHTTPDLFHAFEANCAATLASQPYLQSKLREKFEARFFISQNTRTHISSHCKRACHSMPDAANTTQAAYSSRLYTVTEPPNFCCLHFAHLGASIHPSSSSVNHSSRRCIQGYKKCCLEM
jgi:hypothetical protein